MKRKNDCQQKDNNNPNVTVSEKNYDNNNPNVIENYHINNQQNEQKSTIFEKFFYKNENDKFKCLKCELEMTENNCYKHIKICKGVPKNTCRYCEKQFNHRSNLSRHQKTCKSKMELIPVNEHNNYISSQVNNNITNNNGNNIHGDHNNINSNNHITINALGDPQMYLQWYYKRESEDPEKFQKFLSDVVKNGQSGMCDLMKDVHLNNNYLEYQNLKKTNKKDPTCEYYDGQEWQFGVFRNCILKSIHEFKDMGFFDKIIEENQSCCRNFFHEVAQPLRLLSEDTIDAIYDKLDFDQSNIDFLTKHTNDMIHLLSIMFYVENKKKNSQVIV
jgi:hypothetical protein